jgi:hypothetical protein
VRDFEAFSIGWQADRNALLAHWRWQLDPTVLKYSRSKPTSVLYDHCVNGHPFTVGECGMPMETSRFPECGERVGGAHHRAVEGVTRAEDIENQFGRMHL